MTDKALPERYRLARNVNEGYEIKTKSGDWLRVEHTMHIVSPLQVSSFRLSDDTRLSAHPRDKIMCRRPAGGAA